MSDASISDNRAFLKGLVEKALQGNTFSFSKVSYDINFGFVPTPTGQIAPAYIVALFVPNPLLGQPALGHVMMLPDPMPSQATMDDMVRNGMTQLREQKAQQL